MGWPQFKVTTNEELFETTNNYLESPVHSEKHLFTVSVAKERSFSDEHPGALIVKITNKSEVKLETMFGVTPPCSRYVGESQNGDSLVVIPLNSRDSCINADLLLPKEPPWKITEELEIPQVGTSITLEETESISEDYAILLPFESNGEYKRGSYTFIDQIKYQMPQEDHLKNVFKWSFDVKLEV